MVNLQAELILNIHVICSSSLEVGKVIDGNLNVIPIIGGTFDGKIKGSVMPIGADWNIDKGNGIANVSAKYVLKTEDDECISIENEGVIDFLNESTIKTRTKFLVDNNSQYAWLNTGVYVGALEGGDKPGEIEIKVYRML